MKIANKWWPLISVNHSRQLGRSSHLRHRCSVAVGEFVRWTPLNKSRFETTKELLANGTVIPRPPKLCMIGDRPGLADCIMISLCFCTIRAEWSGCLQKTPDYRVRFDGFPDTSKLAGMSHETKTKCRTCTNLQLEKCLSLMSRRCPK